MNVISEKGADEAGYACRLNVVDQQGLEDVTVSGPGKIADEIVLFNGYSGASRLQAPQLISNALVFVLIPFIGPHPEVVGDAVLVRVQAERFRDAADILIAYLNAPMMSGGLVCVDLMDQRALLGRSRLAVVIEGNHEKSVRDAVENLCSKVADSRVGDVYGAGMAILIPDPSICGLEQLEAAARRFGTCIDRLGRSQYKRDPLIVATAYIGKRLEIRAVALISTGAVVEMPSHI